MELVIEAVSVDRGDRRVLDKCSAKVASGEALAVSGPNGSGKSTLLRAIAGLLPISEGAIRLEEPPDTAPYVHYVGHLNALKPQLSVFENVAFWQRWFGLDAHDESVVDDALSAVRLIQLADLPASTLSQGQRRRLALSRLLIAPRPVWLLDEPTAGLDSASQDAFSEMIGRHLTGGGLLVAATHEPLRAPSLRHLRLG